MKASIRIKYGAKTYRVTNGWKCASKRDCDLFKAGVCNFDGYQPHLPCDEIRAAFERIRGTFDGCLKEVK